MKHDKNAETFWDDRVHTLILIQDSGKTWSEQFMEDSPKISTNLSSFAKDNGP